MGVRLRNEFGSLEGVAWKLDVIDEDYSSSVLTFATEPPGFQLKYSGGKERYDPIQASQCTVFGLVEDSDLEDLIDDVASAGEGRFFLKVYKNTALFWTGKMLMDKATKQDQYYPYSFSMNFTDGIGALKDLEFTNSGVLYTGRETLIGIIAKILGKTGIADQFGSGDAFIKTCVHWYDAHQNFYAMWCPLKYTDLNHMAFYDYSNGENKPKKAWEILEEILLTFGCQIKQSSGVFQIIQPNELANNYIMTRTFTKTGAYITYNYWETYRVSSANFDKLTGGVSKYFPPLYFVRRYYNYSQSPEGTNLIPDQTTYDPAVNFLTDVSGGNDEYLTFEGIIQESFTLSQYEEPFKVKYRLDVVITKSDGTKRYLYNGANGSSGYSWSTQPNQYVTLWSFCGLDPTLQYNGFTEFVFATPEIPWDASGTFRFRKIGYYNLQGNLYTMLGGISFSFYCDDFLFELIYQNQASSEGVITFRADNTNVGDYSKIIELPDSKIGDGPNLYSLGRLKTSDGSTWVNSTLWSIKSGSENKKIHQLLVNEILKGQQQPVEIIDATFSSDTYSGEKCLVIGPAVYIPMNISLSARDDAWKGQWWKIKLQSAAIETGLWIEPGVYEPTYDWYLKSWDVENISEDEESNPNAIAKSLLPDRTSKLLSQGQNSAFLQSVAILNEHIAEGDIKTSLTVESIIAQILISGDKVYLVSPVDFGKQEMTVNTKQEPGNTTLTIDSITAQQDFPIGSYIIMSTYDLVRKINRFWILIAGRWDDDGAWDDTDVWKDA